MKRYPLLEVEWIDAWSKDAWGDYFDEAFRHGMKCRTVGYEIHCGDETIALAGSVNDGQAASVMVIPLAVVVSVRNLE